MEHYHHYIYACLVYDYRPLDVSPTGEDVSRESSTHGPGDGAGHSADADADADADVDSDEPLAATAGKRKKESANKKPPVTRLV